MAEGLSEPDLEWDTVVGEIIEDDAANMSDRKGTECWCKIIMFSN